MNLIQKLHLITFLYVINNARDEAFSEIKLKQRPQKFSHSPWITKGLIVSQKRKEKLFAKKKRNPSDINKKTFKQYNTIYNKLRRAAKMLYFDTQLKQIL